MWFCTGIYPTTLVLMYFSSPCEGVQTLEMVGGWGWDIKENSIMPEVYDTFVIFSGRGGPVLMIFLFFFGWGRYQANR